MSRGTEMVTRPFEELVGSSDLVLQASVAPLRTYLSDDQYDVFTDFLVTPLTVLLQRTPDTSAVPGDARSIVVRQYGGRMVLDGVQITAVNRDAVPFDTTPTVVLFLKRAQTGGYELVHERLGVFRVRDGQLEPPTTAGDYSRFRGMSIGQLDAEIRQLTR
jgi:hypothetical protein